MKILMVLTSHDVLGNTGRKTGFWLEEFAAPYFVFRDAGVDLTLCSPQGGQPPIDPKSDLPENQTAAMARFKEDGAAQKELSKTRKLADMKSRDFDTIFYVQAPPLHRTLTLLGQRVELAITPSTFRWVHGDGTTSVTS